MSRDISQGYCPTCGTTGADECSTSTGRDHPARRHFALGYETAAREGRAVNCPTCARDDRCCSEHRKHVNPHRGCILR